MKKKRKQQRKYNETIHNRKTSVSGYTSMILLIDTHLFMFLFSFNFLHFPLARNISFIAILAVCMGSLHAFNLYLMCSLILAHARPSPVFPPSPSIYFTLSLFPFLFLSSFGISASSLDVTKT